jgi:rhodanese-related sulfurtransferase
MTVSITPQQLADVQQRGQPVDLIDVRTPAEFLEMHVPFARNVPLDQLDPRQIAKEHAGDRYYLICRSGSRGKQACEKLAAAALEVVNVEGGTLAWEAAGLPLVRGPATISLERQVRIAAGVLVLSGALLGYFVHPYWIALVAFVGAGLVFSGITNTCGMGMLLARMPWNQAQSKPACATPANVRTRGPSTKSCCG